MWSTQARQARLYMMACQLAPCHHVEASLPPASPPIPATRSLKFAPMGLAPFQSLQHGTPSEADERPITVGAGSAQGTIPTAPAFGPVDACAPKFAPMGPCADPIRSNLRIVGLKKRRRNGKEMPQFLVLHHFWFSLSPVGNNVGKGFTPFPRHLSPPSIHRHIRDLRRRTGYTCTILGSAGAYIRDPRKNLCHMTHAR